MSIFLFLDGGAAAVVSAEREPVRISSGALFPSSKVVRELRTRTDLPPEPGAQEFKIPHFKSCPRRACSLRGRPSPRSPLSPSLALQGRGGGACPSGPMACRMAPAPSVRRGAAVPAARRRWGSAVVRRVVRNEQGRKNFHVLPVVARENFASLCSRVVSFRARFWPTKLARSRLVPPPARPSVALLAPSSKQQRI